MIFTSDHMYFNERRTVVDSKNRKSIIQGMLGTKKCQKGDIQRKSFDFGSF